MIKHETLIFNISILYYTKCQGSEKEVLGKQRILPIFLLRIRYCQEFSLKKLRIHSINEGFVSFCSAGGRCQGLRVSVQVSATEPYPQLQDKISSPTVSTIPKCIKSYEQST